MAQLHLAIRFALYCRQPQLVKPLRHSLGTTVVVVPSTRPLTDAQQNYALADVTHLRFIYEDLVARIEDGSIFLTVTDQGPGIPDYALQKVFDKFFSLQRPESGEKSTGLGLNFVREVAELHNGQARLENRSEKGARATLVIAT